MHNDMHLKTIKTCAKRKIAHKTKEILENSLKFADIFKFSAHIFILQLYIINPQYVDKYVDNFYRHCRKTVLKYILSM